MKKLLLIASILLVCFLVLEKQRLFTSTLAQNEISDAFDTTVSDNQTRVADRQLAQTIRELTNRSSEGLTQTIFPDGEMLTDLQGRFRNLMLARIDTDGEPVAACVTDLKEANNFLGRNLETGEAVPQTPFQKEDLATRAARHGMSEQEFVFYSNMIDEATRQEQLMSPATATITVLTSADTAGEGFNDPAAPAVPNEGGNTGATLGQQRQILFNHAAQQIWGTFLDSAVPTRINAKFDPILPCNSSGGVLGSAGSNFLDANFTNAQFANTSYHIALRNKQRGTEILAPAQNHIDATINSSVDLACLNPGTRFYYGLDANEPGGTINLLVVVLHELGHGLGFSSFVNGTTGVFPNNRPDIYSRFMLDEDSGLLWANMTDAQRAASALNNENVVWNGANVLIASGSLPVTAGLGNLLGSVNLFTPSSFQGGSSISHFSSAVSPNLLMEPAINGDAAVNLDLTRQQMRDLGWYRDTTNNTSRDQITTVAPNSGTVNVASTRNITWTNTESFARNVTIELSTDGGATFPTTIAANQVNTGTFSWNIPNATPLTTQARIRVREVGFSDPAGISAANFAIEAALPTSATVPVFGRIADAGGRGIARAVVTLTDSQGNLRTVQSNPFGYFRFQEVAVGATYFISVRHKRYRFMSQVINLSDSIELNFAPMNK